MEISPQINGVSCYNLYFSQQMFVDHEQDTMRKHGFRVRDLSAQNRIYDNKTEKMRVKSTILH